MQLYLMRHGTAVRRENRRFIDSERPLTAAGIRNLKIQTKKLKDTVKKFDLIVSSPYRRCKQTAELTKNRFNSRLKIIADKSFAPGGRITKQKKLLCENESKKKVLVVGHSPDLELLAASLLKSSPQFLEFKKGSVARIDITKRAKTISGRLVWVVTPKILRSLK